MTSLGGVGHFKLGGLGLASGRIFIEFDLDLLFADHGRPLYKQQRYDNTAQIRKPEPYAPM